eukprot:558899-Pyramimonas_sp.AAC.1
MRLRSIQQRRPLGSAAAHETHNMEVETSLKVRFCAGCGSFSPVGGRLLGRGLRRRCPIADGRPPTPTGP